MFVNGRKIAERILENLKEGYKKLIIDIERPVSLSVIKTINDPVINQYINKKKEVAESLGIKFLVYNLLDPEIDNNKIVEFIREESQKTDGLIVQLPLRDGLDKDFILSNIPEEVDVDLLNPLSFQKNFTENPQADIMPPVAGAIFEIFQEMNFDPRGKKNVIVGQGRLVGYPAGILLKKMDADFEVIKIDTPNKEELFKSADLIISGAGVPNLVKTKYLKKGVALIDAGTSTERGRVVGDIQLSAVKKASWFSKTPGGVGPITVVYIYKNMFNLILKKLNK